jgi:hypothetical protein
LQLTSESGGEAGADLQRRIFRAEGVSGADSEGSAEKFSDCGAEGDVAIEDVEGGLGLVDATAADSGKNVQNQYGDDESGERGDDDDPQAVRLWERAEQGEMGPVDGKAEADDGRWLGPATWRGSA